MTISLKVMTLLHKTNNKQIYRINTVLQKYVFSQKTGVYIRIN